jgi:hypothetical protein
MVLNEKFQFGMKQCECLKCPLKMSMKIWTALQITSMTPPSNVCPRQWWALNSFCNAPHYCKITYSSFTMKVLKHFSYFLSQISWVSITASLHLQTWTHMERHYIKYPQSEVSSPESPYILYINAHTHTRHVRSMHQEHSFNRCLNI